SLMNTSTCIVQCRKTCLTVRAGRREKVAMSATVACTLAEQLEKDGFALVPDLVSPEQLRGMQLSFGSRLRHMRLNDVDAYEINERYRHFVQDLLTLDQGFVDAALDPRVTETVREYVGPGAQLCEVKGWRSIPTR